MSLETPAALKHDSTDSEPDEQFIDDATVPINSIASNAKAAHLAALYSAPDAAEIIKAAEMVEDGKKAVGKEDVGLCDC